jgi:adenosylcobinamide-phosphate synthase
VTLFAIIVALVLDAEQVHALPIEAAVRRPIARLAAMPASWKRNSTMAGAATVPWPGGWVLPCRPRCCRLRMPCCGISSPSPRSCWALRTLYLTVGFRQFSHFFTGIHLALAPAASIDEARQPARRMARPFRRPPEQRRHVARLAIEQALLDSHRHVFAPLAVVRRAGPRRGLVLPSRARDG